MLQDEMEVDDRKFSQPVLGEGANGNLKNDPCLRLVADLGNRAGRPRLDKKV